MRFNCKYLVLFLLFAFQSKVISQQIDSISTIEKKSLEGYFYKEVIENTNASNAHIPLLIALHWMRSTPDEFSIYMKGFKTPVRILFVEGPYEFKEGYSFYATSPENYYKMSEDNKMKVLLAETEKLSKFIEAATKLYSPTVKPAIIGASQGGDLSFVIGLNYNHLISLSCPLLATIDDRIIFQDKPAKLASIVAFHGIEDPIVNVNTIKNHIKNAKKQGFKAKLHLYKRVKHEISYKMKSDYITLISNSFMHSP